MPTKCHCFSLRDQNREGAGCQHLAAAHTPPPGHGTHCPAPNDTSAWENTTTGRPRAAARRHARQLPRPGWKATRPLSADATTWAAQPDSRARSGTPGPPPAHQETAPPRVAKASTGVTADT